MRRTSAILTAGLLQWAAVTQAIEPRIVRGETTFEAPAVGALLTYRDGEFDLPRSLCSGTLIGCRTFLTAAHCVCPSESISGLTDAEVCARLGSTAPSRLRVFLPHAGFFPVSGVAIHPEYDFGTAGDVAIVTLGRAVTGVPAARLNLQGRIDNGTRLRIFGFGDGVDRNVSSAAAGLKRQGSIVAARCGSSINADRHVCWNHTTTGTAATTCFGDSGGPSFVQAADGPELAGIHSGVDGAVAGFPCAAPASVFDSDVFVHRSWILTQTGQDLGSEACLQEGRIDVLPSRVHTLEASLAEGEERSVSFEVPSSARTLRITANGASRNDVDLFVAIGPVANRERADCRITDLSSWAACEFPEPTAGLWTATVRMHDLAESSRTVQMVVSLLVAPPACPGDCNRDGRTTVNEIVGLVNLALGSGDETACPAGDLDGNGEIAVTEIVAAVNAALHGCPTGPS